MDLKLDLIGKRVVSIVPLYGLFGEVTPPGQTGVIDNHDHTHYPLLIVRMDTYAWADYNPEWFEVVEEG